MQRFIFFLFTFLLGCNAVNQTKPTYPSPPGYNLEEPEKIKLSEKMDEISGIVFYPPLNSLVSINDEMGRIFSIPPDGKSPYPKWKFAKNGDFEDLVYTGKEWYVLKSNGTLFLIRNCFTDSISSEAFPFSEKKENEFEAVYYDSTTDRLNMICKTCKDATAETVKVYGFDLKTHRFLPDPVMEIGVDKSQLDKPFLRPSGVAINPLTHEIYVIASINRLLFVMDYSGKIKTYYPLHKKKFKQPEGICFAPNGDLYISNEAKGGTANILKFKYQPKN